MEKYRDMKFAGRPCLRAGVRFHVPSDSDAGDVLVFAGGEAFLLGKKLYENLVPLLTGEHDRHALVAALKPVVSPLEVLSGVQYLFTMGALEASRTGEAAQPGGADDRRSVSLQAIGSGDLTAAKAALLASGISIAQQGEASLHIVACDHYQKPDLEAINANMDRPWMLVRTAGDLWLGPHFSPGVSACWECLSHRLRFNFRLEEYWLAETGQHPAGASDADADRGGYDPSGSKAALWALAAQAVRSWFDYGQSPVTNGLIRLDPQTLETRRHVVVRRPQCSACGKPLAPPDNPPDLQAPAPRRAKNADAAQATLDAYAHHVSPITGLVDSLTPKGERPGIHIYQGGRYSGYTGKSWSRLASSLSYRAAGKGTTPAKAKAGALAETLEWYTIFADEPSRNVTASAAELMSRAPVVLPNAISHFSAAQYAERKALNSAAKEDKYKIPQPFDPDTPFAWSKAWSLRDERWVYVPANSCPFMKSGSNGNAAGATLAQAVVHGALEAVERDALALWWYNRLPRPAVGYDGVDRNLMDAMHRAYDAVGQKFWVLDITSDLGIPAAVAIACPIDDDDQRYFMGFGAHFDPAIAITRALTEMNQLNPALGDVVVREGRGEAENAQDEPMPAHVLAAPGSPLRMTDGTRDIASRSLAEQAKWTAGRLAEAGLDMLIVDLTLPDVELPVVKVLAPGLRHAYPELGPGRLHDVPLARGWLSKPETEDSMRLLRSPL